MFPIHFLGVDVFQCTYECSLTKNADTEILNLLKFGHGRNNNEHTNARKWAKINYCNSNCKSYHRVQRKSVYSLPFRHAVANMCQPKKSTSMKKSFDKQD